MRRIPRLFVVAVATAIALAGCGSAGDNTSSNDSTGDTKAVYPVTVSAGGTEVTLTAQPKKIVSLSPTGTELLYAVGAGKQVTAVDELSNYPADTPRTKLSGFKPNAEAVVAYQPDLVVLSYDANGVVAALAKLKIPVYTAPAAQSLDDTYKQLTDLGRLTGHPDQAADQVTRMKDEIGKLTADLPKQAKPMTYYYELDPQLHTLTSKTFVGAVFGLAGLRNVADPADKAGTGYPQLSAEALVKGNPDLVFLADTKCCKVSAAALAKRPGFTQLTAVKGGHVYELDDDIASRWGPRVVELLRVVADAMRDVAAG